MNWTLEVVPVSDVDRAKAFCAGKLGFKLDHDTRLGGAQRVVQLTPPGSGCSVVIGSGLSSMPPGSLQELQPVVSDLRAARTALLKRSVEVGEIHNLARPGQPAQPDDDLNNVGFLFFNGPDGWAVQQMAHRT